MLVIPAVDIKGGRCVRLLQGDPDRETVYGDDPVAQALRFQELGAKLIHVVDLDGAFGGRPVNHGIVKKMARALAIPIEIGGGIRSGDIAREYLDAGIRRIIIGTAVLGKEFSGLLEKYPDNIIAGIDAKNSLVATHGWKNVSDVVAVDYIRELWDRGVREVIYTDISTDGMLTGPNYRSIERILDEVAGIRLVASGGVSSIDDLVKLDAYTPRGLVGAIVGKAVYDGRVDLAEAFSRIS
ncbi:MAG: 1-(5-phosphoribosyl)-5-[(5-phosphoribosylamino)methylideneamino]imidazole-4-carboxamide isomerase [Spirochaetes bacterium]|nr:1-(5-phosphoribosyl)-5-[(5-phosphoribosylamino)methylideneamino]imidazole-4-carboxamide isomerase [Spirochaetota bacterium]